MLRQCYGTNCIRHSDECHNNLPCPERYAERRIMLNAAHTNQCELPYYEKQAFFQTTQGTNESVC